jgi:ABC-type sugar transport system substrate-binding protein
MSIPRIALIALVAAALAAVAIAVWPASEADKARDDGEQVGEAVGQLYYADTEAEVDAALADLDEAVTDTRDHAGDEVAEQVAEQRDALARAVDGYVGAVTSEDAFESDLYEAELDVALDDLSTQADDFRTQGPEVEQAFWEGVEDGLPNE